MTAPLHDKRQHLRVRLRSYGTLATPDGICPAHLLDVSPSGALLAVLEPHQLAPGEAARIDIELPSGDFAAMEGHVAHVKEHLVGLDCTPITAADAALLADVIDGLERGRT